MEGDHLMPTFGERLRMSFARQWQRNLDRSTPFIKTRWIFAFGFLLVYLLRVHLLQGWYIVTYGLGIYILNLFIGFLSPQIDPDVGDGPVLPTHTDDEFRPFERRLPEFKFWYSTTKAIAISFLMTFFSMFNVPVYWPILLLYFIVLFVLTMKRQIKHMIEHKYVPFSWGKRVYNKGKAKPKPAGPVVPPISSAK